MITKRSIHERIMERKQKLEEAKHFQDMKKLINEIQDLKEEEIFKIEKVIMKKKR